MASVHLQEKANFTRLNRLLVDKGTEALRITLDALHPPANLPAVLNANRKSLLKLKPRIINDTRWGSLFHPSDNPPDSKTFDAVLLTILLRNICCLPSPATGWNTMPSNTDRSLQANVTRFKLFKYQLFGNHASTQVDNATFETLWHEVSKVLIDLNIPPKEIDDLKICPLGPEEEIYVQNLKKWILKEEYLNDMLPYLEHSIHDLTRLAEESHSIMKEETGKYDEELTSRRDLEVQLREREQAYYEEVSRRRELEFRQRELADRLRDHMVTIERVNLQIRKSDQALPLKVDSETIEGYISKKLKRESSESWAWERKSVIHEEKFLELIRYGRNHPQEIDEVNDVRFCCLKQFLVGMGNVDGTRVYVGLGNDGYERAVKRLPNDNDYSISLAEQEKKILNQPNAMKSNHVVNYRFLDKSNKAWLFLIMDLCEETLEEFVERSSLDGWPTIARDIIQQVLKGLADLHSDPIILHRDLKPSNILRDVDGDWLLADFGISRILPPGVSTIRTGMKGTDHWRAVESCSSNGAYNTGEVRYKKKSDIQVAGMVAFYTVTKGEHPFGEKRDQLGNILDGKPVGLVKLHDHAAKDLISWTLSHDPKDRPLAEQALKHPYLQSEKQKFEMLCKVGNEIEVKTGNNQSDVVRKLNSHDPKDWKTELNADVLTYLCIDALNGRKISYKSSWTDCLRLIRNVKTHWRDRPLPQPEQFYVVGDPQEYFLNAFPNLPVVVHGIVRSSDWKERPDLKEYFT